MVDVKREMAVIHSSRADETLVYLSVSRFDQQETTKPHLDGGPDECFLMLGYEPSEISSELEITDYSKCAFDLGLSPKEFMTKHNPLFKSGHDLLRAYVTRIPCFSRNDFQIVSIQGKSNRTLKIQFSRNQFNGEIRIARWKTFRCVQRRLGVFDLLRLASYLSENNARTFDDDQDEMQQPILEK